MFLKHAFALYALLAALCLPAQAAPAPSDPIPVGAQVRYGKFDNGLTYYIQRNARPEHRLELRLVVKAGSLQEDEDQQGLAHFLEHMAFNGSTHFRKHELVTYLQSIGVNFGADLNAFTNFDNTSYILPVPTQNPAHVQQAFAVLEDWAHGLSLREEDLDTERAVVLEEARTRKGADDRLTRQILPLRVNGARYAERFPIGKEETIKHFTPEQLRRFYRDWYRPDLMAVIAIGDIDPVMAEKEIRARFSAMRNPVPERPLLDAPVPPLQASRAAVLTDKEATGNSVLLQLHTFTLYDQGTYGGFRQKMVDRMVADLLSNRLGEVTRGVASPFQAAGASVGQLAGKTAVTTLSATINGLGARVAVGGLLREAERVRRFGFTSAEFERQKAFLRSRNEQTLHELGKDNSADLAAEYTRHFLLNEEISGRREEVALKEDVIASLSLEQLNARMRELLPADEPSLLLMFGAEAAEGGLPSERQLLTALSQPVDQGLTAYSEKALPRALVETPPSGGKIVSETPLGRTGASLLTLGNGVRVILKHTDFKNDEILMSAQRPGGQAALSEQDARYAPYAQRLIGAMGRGPFDATELSRLVTGHHVNAGFGFSRNEDILDGNSNQADLEMLLQLTWLAFQAPHRDPVRFMAGRDQLLTALRDPFGAPEAVYFEDKLHGLYGDHPRRPRVDTADVLRGLSMERALEIYQSRFSSARGFLFAFVGNFDDAKIKPLLASYLGTLPVGEINTSYHDHGLRIAAGVQHETRKGREPKSIVSLVFGGAVPYSLEEQRRLLLLNDILNIRFIDVLREKLALIYAGGGNAEFESQPFGHFLVDIDFPCAPENTGKVVAAALTEIRAIQAQGPSQADLDKAKAANRLSYDHALKENGAWLSLLIDGIQRGTGDSFLDRAAWIDRVSVHDLQATAKRYLDTDQVARFTLLPEGGTAPASP